MVPTSRQHENAEQPWHGQIWIQVLQYSTHLVQAAGVTPPPPWPKWGLERQASRNVKSWIKDAVWARPKPNAVQMNTFHNIHLHMDVLLLHVCHYWLD